MKTIRYIALSFGMVYAILIVHYSVFDNHTKREAIEEVASRTKHTELSLNFKDKAYKGFIYAH